MCDWYQHPEIYNVLDFINDKKNNLEKIYLFGYSMGGFASINFSYYMNAFFIAFQPQYKLGEVPMTPFYEKCLKNIIGNFNISNISNKKCLNSKGYIFFDPLNEVDLFHCRMIFKNTSSILIEIPYAGHATSSVINKFYKIYSLVNDIISDTFKVQKFRSMITKDLILTFPGYMNYSLKELRTQYDLILKQVKISFSQKIKSLYDNNYYYEVTLLCEQFFKNLDKKDITFKLSHEDIKNILQSFIKTRRFNDFVKYCYVCESYFNKEDKDCYPVILTAKAIYYNKTEDISNFVKVFKKLEAYKSSYVYVTYHKPILRKIYLSVIKDSKE